jgi:hypothetical protein
VCKRGGEDDVWERPKEDDSIEEWSADWRVAIKQLFDTGEKIGTKRLECHNTPIHHIVLKELHDNADKRKK